jgi:hypothetical protein
MNITISELLLFCLAVIGMTHIIVDGSIFQPVRDYLEARLPAKMSELLKCYQCCGFWSGMFLGYFILASNMSWCLCIPVIFAAGCAGSFLAMWATIHLNVLEAKMVMTNYKVEEEETNGN